jgi:hypothetical protein
MRNRSWSIRSRIVLLVVPPIVMLTVFWLIGTTLSARGSVNLLNANTALAAIVEPGRDVIAAVREERRLSAVLLGGRPTVAASLRDQRARTDMAVADFRRLAGDPDTRGALSDQAAERASEAIAAFQALSTVRAAVDTSVPDRARTLAGYDTVIGSVFHAFQPLSELDDPESTRLFRAASNVEFARELLARADAVVEAVSVTGRFTPADHAQFAQAVGARRVLLADAPAELNRERRATFAQLIAGPELTGLRAAEERVIEARTGVLPQATVDSWRAGFRAADERLRAHTDALDAALARRGSNVATTYYWRLGLTGAIGLAAILFSIVVTVRVGRSLIRRLRGLRGAALELAQQRLPAVVHRLRQGEDVDVAAEAPPLAFGDDEIGQVGNAFSHVQRTAVQSAIQEAGFRRGLNEVFLNIARRSQTLLHRQLAVLDRMERRATDPDELEDLFRVDHLATRMRRHAEDLVILAGATPGRKWRRPVPLVDVIRGAVSEVEDYARVQVTSVADGALVGRAVTDLIHLLAELLENATSYSPPHTKVNVTGEPVPNGFVVEIEDRGLGMTPDEIDAANARLRQPPDFDPANSARLGLFVVALLAARLDTQVTLRCSPYGGITTVVLVPRSLLDTPLAFPPPQRRAIGARPSPDLSLTGSVVAVPLAPAAVTTEPASDERAPEDATESRADGLPRRVRPAPAPARSTVDEPAPAPPQAQRSPTETRAMMSAFQAGTVRGRRDAQATVTDPEQEA